MPHGRDGRVHSVPQTDLHFVPQTDTRAQAPMSVRGTKTQEGHGFG
ncbi:hypothetical protein JNB_09989 [Janibacter sp. HTCC2649]|nr:hypothetical protein JNB_09989 [Janibacter sp. HTCC2649]